MAELPKIDSEGLRLAKKAGSARVSSVVRVSKSECKHDWAPWKVIGRTGDWFNPNIMRRDCKKCAAWQTEDR